MKLKNKKTGEIIEPCEIYCDTQDKICVRRPGENFGVYIDYEYNSLSELNEEWEDAPEEPKEYWYINEFGNICDREAMTLKSGWDDKPLFEFETREEAELAVEKLKAWKRLKDKGFRFCRHWAYNYDYPKVENQAHFEFVAICEDGILFDDLDLLFGGEE